jgi:hypothetical protein
MDTNGVMLIDEREEGRGKTLLFTLLDTNLKKQWQKKITADNSLLFLSSYTSQEKIFLLFRHKNSYQIDVFDLATKELQEIIYKNDIKLEITHFSVAQNNIFFFGGSIRYHPAVVRFDPTTSETKLLSSLHQLDATLHTIKIDEISQTLCIALTDDTHADKKIYVNRYSTEGQLLTQKIIERLGSFAITDYEVAVVNEEMILLSGTYHTERSAISQGVFLLKINPQGELMVHIHDFSSFDNFFAHLPENKRRKLVEKIEQKKAQGKIYPLRYSVLLHKPILKDTILYLSGELYELQRNYQARPFDDLSNSPYRYSAFPNSIYRNGTPTGYRTATPVYTEEYKFERLFVAAFSINGNKFWDNQLLLDNKISLKRQPYSHFTTPANAGLINEKLATKNLQSNHLNEFITLFYVEKDKIHYTSSQPNTYQPEIKEIDLPLIIENDHVSNYSDEQVLHWYQQSYIYVSSRTVNNKTLSKRNRSGWLLRKIDFF